MVKVLVVPLVRWPGVLAEGDTGGGKTRRPMSEPGFMGLYGLWDFFFCLNHRFEGLNRLH